MEAKIKCKRWRAACIIALFLVALFIVNCSTDDKYPKNIILLIGDGMGVAQITAGKIVRGQLNLEPLLTGLD